MDNLKTLYHKLDAIENALYKLCALIGAIAMGIAFCAIFLQVLYRYILCNFLNLPLAFTEELARYCLFWIIYLLLPSVMKSGMEAANTFLAQLAKGKSQNSSVSDRSRHLHLDCGHRLLLFVCDAGNLLGIHFSGYGAAGLLHVWARRNRYGNGFDALRD